MDTQTLQDYLERQGVLSGSNPRLASSSQAFSSRQASLATYAPITQHARIPSLIALWRQFQTNPRLEFHRTMEAIRSELLELEKNHRVVLLNRSVVSAAALAKKYMALADEKWRPAPNIAVHHAEQAIVHQMRSLIESYRTVAAFRIVSTREKIEDKIFLSIDPKQEVLHEEARAFFKAARHHQDIHDFADATHYNMARKMFTQAIHTTEAIDIKADTLLNRHSVFGLIFGGLSLLGIGALLLLLIQHFFRGLVP